MKFFSCSSHLNVWSIIVFWTSLALFTGECQVALGKGAPDMQLFDNPYGALSIHPVAEDGALYGRALSRAKWHVGQWNNPSGDIEDFRADLAANDSLSIKINNTSDPSVTIQQNGRLLRCSGEGGAPLEFDGLIGANTSTNNRGFPTAELGAKTHMPLSEYTSLTQQIRFSLLSNNLEDGGDACSVSKAVGVLCVVLSNSQIHSTLFVQVLIYAFNTAPRSVWWARGTRNGRFGYNIVLPIANQAWHNGDQRVVDQDLLPTIVRLITENTIGMDQNPQHWYVSGAYFGTAVYGHANVTTRWSGFRLSATWQK